MLAVLHSIAEAMCANNAAGVENDTITEDGARVQNHTREELAIFANAASMHNCDATMQVRAVIDRAAILNASKSIDRRMRANLGGVRNTCKWIDSVFLRYHDLRSEKLAYLRKGFVWVIYDDLWDSNAGESLIGNAGRCRRNLQFRKVFLIIQ